MAQNLDDLDYAFELLAEVDDPRMRALYEVLISRMTKEAEHLPMGTVQLLLIERIATNYIVMREKERGRLGGYQHSSQQKDWNIFWLSMTQEFNRMLGKSGTATDRKALLQDMQKIIVEVVATIPDNKVRHDVLQQLATRFESVGI